MNGAMDGPSTETSQSTCPLSGAMTGSALARFNFLISSSEYPFFAIAASLACCNSSSKRFLATPDL